MDRDMLEYIQLLHADRDRQRQTSRHADRHRDRQTHILTQRLSQTEKLAGTQAGRQEVKRISMQTSHQLI